MEVFPTLSTTPLVEPFEDSLQDPGTVKSPKDAGYVQTRPRHTRLPGQWHVGYSGLTAADRTALRNHELAVKVDADIFSWTHPLTSAQHNVRFRAAVRYKAENTFDGGAHTWSAEFDLDEA